MKILIFETKRLILKPISLEDAPQIQNKFPHWEIVKYLNASSIPWPYPDDGAEFFIREIALPKIKTGEVLTWSIFLKDAPEVLIGVISLMNNEDENRGFWIAKEYQNNGYITEASKIVTDFWFNELKKEKIIIPKAKNNIPSRRISQKQNMRLVGTKFKNYLCGESMCEIWEITREEWFNN